MANSTKQIRAQQGNKEIVFQKTTTDAPILPVAQLEKLHQFRPDLVDFIVDQTKSEAIHRRKEESKISNFIFIERMLGLIASVIVCLSGIGGGIYAALSGHPWLGGVIATASIGTLAVAYLKRNNKK